jgi:hypothetical protein
VDVSQVRRQLRSAIDAGRARTQARRERVAEAERVFGAFLDGVATPLMQQLTQALKAEGFACTLFTPGGSLRLAFDRSRDDFIELTLDTSGEYPRLLACVRHTRGSRIVDDERALTSGGSPPSLPEDELLDCLIRGLEPWLQR